MPFGPQKIILINSGRYDFAEVELAGALQIVGPNNTGKTTLINTLQFLYIDDLRRMDFGPYTPEQTRDYYFPGQFSYALFECLGVSGQCVIGWRGQSKAAGAEPERFCYSGPFEASDFLDQNKVREPRDISARLALKEYRTIKSAQEHRELLLTPANAKSRGLGVVSLRDTDGGYRNFRETFKNLLSLTSITQEQMRERLLMLAGIPSDRVALDARELFGDDYDRIRARRESFVRFKKHQSQVDLLVDKFEQRESARGELIVRWDDLRTKARHFEAEHETKLTGLRAKKQTALDGVTELGNQVTALRDSITSSSEAKGRLQMQLDQIAAQAQKFRDFVKELEAAALNNLRLEITQLDRQLADAEKATRDAALKKIEVYGILAKRKAETLQQFDRAAITTLRRHFSDDELEPLFRLLNREILEYTVAPKDIEIHNETGLLSELRALIARIESDAYRDRNVSVSLRPNALSVSSLPDVESLKAELAEHTKILNEWNGILRAIEQREALAAALRGKRIEEETATKRLNQFEDYQTALKGKPKLDEELKAIEGAIQTARTRIGTLEVEISAAQKSVESCSNAIRDEENQFNSVIGRFNQCVNPIFLAKLRPVTDTPADFDATISLYLRLQEKEEKLTDNVTNLLLGVEGSLGSEFTGIDEAETIRNLQAELEAIPDKEEALARDWNAHIHGLKAAFDGVLKELSEVKSAADSLNRHFARVHVSNLKSLHMDVEDVSDWVTWIRRLAEMQQPGLFDEDTSLEPTLRNFRQRLQSNPVVRFAHLFTLGFTIVGEDDKPKRYHDFRQIESHGTTITIKVLFNLLVLKSQLRKDDCAVPFFLDEIQALDPDNRHAILATARKLGFIAITAAPDSVSEVDALYFLQPRRGRIVLRDKDRLLVKTTRNAA
jgi:hypothetical protein